MLDANHTMYDTTRGRGGGSSACSWSLIDSALFDRPRRIGYREDARIEGNLISRTFGTEHYADGAGNAALKARCTSATTLSQSPMAGCRNSRADGYQGLSARSMSQRQSAENCSIIQVGRPSAAARCATEVSTVITRSSSDRIAA